MPSVPARVDKDRRECPTCRVLHAKHAAACPNCGHIHDRAGEPEPKARRFEPGSGEGKTGA